MTPEEFQRAVRVCTGTPLDDRMVKLTFKIFDEDGDGNLSHEEFMKVLFNSYFGIICMILLLNFILIDKLLRVNKMLQLLPIIDKTTI